MQYRIPGHEEVLKETKSPNQVDSSDTSLQLKHAGKDLQLQQTPSRTEPSEDSCSVTIVQKAQDPTGTIPELDHVPETPPIASRFPPDDLSKAIEEAQAIKDLVSAPGP